MQREQNFEEFYLKRELEQDFEEMIEPEETPFTQLERFFSKEDIQNEDKKCVEKFCELLKCFICYKQVDKPMICRHCSGFACKECFVKWLGSKQECPVCRNSLGESQIVKCKFLDDISKLFNDFDFALEKKFRLYEFDSTENLCEIHGMKILYFCRDCNKLICSDCYTFTKHHNSHDIIKLEEIYKNRIKELKSEFGLLDKKINNLNDCLETLNNKQEDLKKIKVKRYQQLSNLFQEMKDCLENEYQKSVNLVNQEKRMRIDNLTNLNHFSNDLRNRIKTEDPITIIKNSSNYLKGFKIISSIKEQKKISDNLIEKFKQDKLLRKFCKTFQIHNFRKKQKENQIYYSDLLQFQGIQFRLKIYPNGANIFKGEFMSIFVEMVKGWQDGGSYNYKIRMVNNNPNDEDLEKEYISDFEDSVCWGYNRFYRLEELETNGFLDNSNIITLQLEISASNYVQKIQDQGNYINQLEQNLDEKDKLIKKLQEKLKKKKKKTKKISKIKQIPNQSVKTPFKIQNRPNFMTASLIQLNLSRKKKNANSMSLIRDTIYSDKNIPNLYQKYSLKKLSSKRRKFNLSFYKMNKIKCPQITSLRQLSCKDINKSEKSFEINQFF